MEIEEINKEIELIEERRSTDTEEMQARRQLVIDKFKEFNNREPTEAEIQEDINWLIKAKQGLRLRGIRLS